MICDTSSGKCAHSVQRGVRVVIPARDFLLPGHTAIKVMTTLHYCEAHAGELKLEDVLDLAMRLAVEKCGRATRPIGFKPDFDAAFVEYVLVTTPEYRAWLKSVSIEKLVQEQGGPPVRQAVRDYAG